jgi:undecaprenyl-diphosphatase
MVSGFESFVLGTLQGLTEFLPVSSSAHLILVPWLFGWPDPGLAFDVMLHLGTLLALVIFYWSDWLTMITSMAGGPKVQRRTLTLLIAASLPGAIIGFLFEKQAESLLRSPVLIACTLALMGVALWVFDRQMPRRRKIGEMNLFDAILIGLSQALALVPGVSRSGATITMGRILNLTREDAANFSFLMATPIIAGAGLLEVRKLAVGGMNADLWLGFSASALFGLLAIAGLIHFVRARSYAVFAWYRIALATVVIAAISHRG